MKIILGMAVLIAISPDTDNAMRCSAAYRDKYNTPGSIKFARDLSWHFTAAITDRWLPSA